MICRRPKEKENLMANDTPQPPSRAASTILSTAFFGLLSAERPSFESFEEKAIRLGHEVIAEAMAIALERYDAMLCAELPGAARVHDRRERVLATEVGDVSFSWRRVRGGARCRIPLAEALDLPWGCRVSPGAAAFLVEAGAEVSYAKAARLLARKGGSKVSATTVMRAMRAVGAACEREDEASAGSLFSDGVKPGGAVEAEEICMEADGTWVRLQGTCEGEPKRVEIKGMVAYDGKVERGRKVARKNTVHHGCVAPPGRFWPQSIAAVAERFDLSKVERVHLGTDGEGWCKRGGGYLPMRIETIGHLDPFHVNRAVLSCFEDARAGWRVLEVLLDGDKQEAACLLEASIELGVAREKNARRVAGYLRNNMDLIGAEGPSLGTMESENQHLYSARMEAFPCAWSRQGASDMARIRSRMHSRRALPKMTRATSVTPARRRRDAARESRSLPEGLPAGAVVQSSGRGYLPKQASVAGASAEVRFAAGLNSGMPRFWG